MEAGTLYIAASTNHITEADALGGTLLLLTTSVKNINSSSRLKRTTCVNRINRGSHDAGLHRVLLTQALS